MTSSVYEFWPVAVAFAGGLVAWGDLRAKVVALRKDVDTKASNEIVDAHYLEIIARLDRMERKLNGAT